MASEHKQSLQNQPQGKADQAERISAIETSPVHKNHEGLYLLLAALAALLLLLPLNSARATPAQIDEFIVLSSAKAIYQGALPYHDYFNFIPPLSHAIYAGLFALVGGPNAGAARLLTDLIIILCGLLAYSLLRRLGLKIWAASLPALILLSLFFALWPIPLHHWWGLFFSLLSIYFLARALWPLTQDAQQSAAQNARSSEPSKSAVLVEHILSGVFMGLSALTVQTHGFINFAALIAMLLFASQNTQNSKQNTRPVWRDRKLLISLLMISLGSLVVLGIFTLYLVVTGTFVSFFNESILFVFFQYSSGHNHNTMSFLSDLAPRLRNLQNLTAPAWIRYSLSAASLAALASVGIAALSSLVFVLVALTKKQWRKALALTIPWLAAYLAMLGRPDLFHLGFYALIPLLATSLAVAQLESDDAKPEQYLQKTKDNNKLQTTNGLKKNHSWFGVSYHILLSLCLSLGLWGHLLLPWIQGGRIPGFFAQTQDSDPVFAHMPAVDAAMVQNNGLYELVRSYALQHPDAQLFASINGIPAYFLAMPPSCRETVVYPPDNSFSGPREYQRVLDDFRAQPPALLLFIPQNADKSYLDAKHAGTPQGQDWQDFVHAHYHFVISNGRGKVYQRNDAADLQLEL